MTRTIRNVNWWLVLCALPLFWFSGHLLVAFPGQTRGMASDAPHWLVPVAGGLLLFVFPLSRLSLALGVESLRTLLTDRQMIWFGVLITAIFCVAWTGLLWSMVNEDQVGVVIWQI